MAADDRIGLLAAVVKDPTRVVFVVVGEYGDDTCDAENGDDD